MNECGRCKNANVVREGKRNEFGVMLFRAFCPDCGTATSYKPSGFGTYGYGGYLDLISEAQRLRFSNDGIGGIGGIGGIERTENYKSNQNKNNTW